MRVNAVGEASALAGIRRLVEQAQASRSRAQALADRAAALLARKANAAAASGRSPYLAELSKSGRRLDARDVSLAAQHGDPFSVELLTRSGQLVGAMLATLVNFYNPPLIIIGGGVAASGDLSRAAASKRYSV